MISTTLVKKANMFYIIGTYKLAIFSSNLTQARGLYQIYRMTSLQSAYFFDNPATEAPGLAIKIVAILDWDNMSAVPTVLSRAPPFWLWDYDAPAELTSLNQHENRRIYKEDPDLYPVERLESKTGILYPWEIAIKQRFDSYIESWSPGYLVDAYGERGRLLRRLWRLLRRGIICQSDFEIHTTVVNDFGAALPLLKEKHKKKTEDRERDPSTGRIGIAASNEDANTESAQEKQQSPPQKKSWYWKSKIMRPVITSTSRFERVTREVNSQESKKSAPKVDLSRKVLEGIVTMFRIPQL